MKITMNYPSSRLRHCEVVAGREDVLGDVDFAMRTPGGSVPTEIVRASLLAKTKRGSLKGKIWPETIPDAFVVYGIFTNIYPKNEPVM